jgi:hypothetical protein
MALAVATGDLEQKCNSTRAGTLLGEKDGLEQVDVAELVAGPGDTSSQSSPRIPGWKVMTGRLFTLGVETRGTQNS